MTDTPTDDSELLKDVIKMSDKCRECGDEIESGIVCSDCESRMDDLISGFARLNNNDPKDTEGDQL